MKVTYFCGTDEENLCIISTELKFVITLYLVLCIPVHVVDYLIRHLGDPFIIHIDTSDSLVSNYS